MTTDKSAIGDYAIIGDCRTAALVSRHGSLDWLCLPRFDSPSLFAALLDAESGGRFSVRPAGSFRASRRYLDRTNVLETTFSTENGVVRLTDCMVVPARDEPAHLAPDHEIQRRLDGVTGEVELEVLWDPRPDFGRSRPRLRDRGSLGFFCEDGSDVAIIRSDVALRPAAEDGALRGTVRVRAGARRHLSMSFSHAEPAVLPVLGDRADAKISGTVEWWRFWAERCANGGPYREAVIRSALALKLLTFAPSGAVIAAPTTSLPERIGGVRNWDYRFCWLRDAALTTRALFDLGYPDEARAFLNWLLHATRLTFPELQVVYDVYGETKLPERELRHLKGFAGSRPVRVGNGATDQLQLDVYGEVVDAAFSYTRQGGRLDRASAHMLVGLGESVCRRWEEPDEGIWEVRSGRRHHTLSKVMCWVALDRLLTLHEENQLRAPARRFAASRDAIRNAVETRAYSSRLGSYVDAFDGEEVDAGLLLLGIHGYCDPASPRMKGTLAAVRERLGTNGLVYRYRAIDGLPPGEGAFGICSFWAVEQRARQGDVRKAIDEFEHVLSYANDVGLFGEQIDPGTGLVLGNFPQAFTHVGLINAALTLERLGAASPRSGGSGKTGTERDGSPR